MARTASILIVALVVAGSVNRSAGQEPQKSEKQVNEKKAAVDAAAARLAGAQAKRNEAAAVLDQYKATVDRWQIQRDRLEKETRDGVVEGCNAPLELDRQLRTALAEFKTMEAVLAIAEKEVAVEKARLDQASAELGQVIEKQLNAKKAAVDAASARLAKAQAKRDAAAEELDQYEATVNRWQNKEARLRGEEDFVGPAILTEIRRQQRISQAEFKEAQSALAILEKKVAVEKARLNLARAELDLAQAKVEQAQMPAKDDTTAKLLKVQAAAAQRAYQAHLDDMAVQKIGDLLVMVKGNTTARPDLVYTWSVRWLDAQRDLSESEEQRIAACQDHQKRMKQLHDQVKLMVGGGNSGLLRDSAVPESEWYLAEAELWLLKERGKNAK